MQTAIPNTKQNNKLSKSHGYRSRPKKGDRKMANIVIKDLEMDKELDKVSLLDIVGGCHKKHRVCFRRRIKYLKRVAYRKRVVKYVTAFKFVPAYKTIMVCYWR
jgi:hypothetical protein